MAAAGSRQMDVVKMLLAHGFDANPGTHARVDDGMYGGLIELRDNAKTADKKELYHGWAKGPDRASRE